MSSEGEVNLPPLQRDEYGQVDVDSVPDVIEWFLNYDQRVAIIRHPSVEEVFQWKQDHTEQQGEEVFRFKQAEDRLAIGIIQALADNSTPRGDRLRISPHLYNTSQEVDELVKALP